MRFVKLVSAALALVLVVGACSDDGGGSPNPRKSESDIREGSYQAQVKGQPAKTMSYSPSRETINFWIDTWDQEGKLSFVYLMAGNGQIVGYYVLKGLPVSYCAALTPTWDFVSRDSGEFFADVMIPAPGVDGVYYSGGQCNQYYGIDATTGAYVEWSIGGSLNYLLFSEPIPVEAPPLGFTRVDDPAVAESLAGQEDR